MKKLASFLRLSWQVSPSYIIVLILDAFANGAKLLFNIILPKFLVDELLGARDVNVLFLFVGLIVANNVLMSLLENGFKAVKEKKESYFTQSMNKKMAEKIMKLEYSCLEDPYYLDLKERAVYAISNQNAVKYLVDCAAKMFSGAVTLAGLIAIMATLGPVLVLIVAVGVVVMLLFYAGMSKYMVYMQQELVPINRKFGYYFDLAFEKQNQKDIRLYDMADMVQNRLSSHLEGTCDIFEKIFRRMGKSFGGMSVVNDAVAAISYAYVGFRTLSTWFGPKISIGSLTMYVSCAIQFSATVVDFGTNIVGMLQQLAFLDPYLEFMGLAEETKETGKAKFVGPVESIEFKDVTFTYPKAEKPVLKHVFFSIHKGEKISIVGLNGAGKSTLVKLICRMYHMDSGEILINGRNIYDYDYLSYMKCIAAVFQDYRLFNFTIAENISCQEKGADRKRIEKLIDEVGLREKIDELKDGIDSRFGKEYDEDGVEMSGGQGQKVAIARALYKDSSLVILDEPASALDPIAEAEIYEKFNGLVDDKTAIYISHRMSSSVFCDRILIIDGGTVSDFDTHENLMKKTESLYYKLFESQAKNYRLEA